MIKVLSLAFCCFFGARVTLAGLAVGIEPKKVVLSGEAGGKVEKDLPWSSEELRGKVFVLFYVDPDENSLNDAVATALKEQHYDHDKFQSVAVINLAASWKPNFVIESVLKDRQKEFPYTIYVKDRQKVLVKDWGLADQNNNVVAFSKEGKVIFRKDGKLSEGDIAKLIAAVKEHY